MGNLTEALIEEIRNTSDSTQREVFAFLSFLKIQEGTEHREDLLPLAQTAWAADWNTPEEDEAWRNL